MTELLQRTEAMRSLALKQIGKANLGKFEQFFTPLPVAELMADLIRTDTLMESQVIRILDPGAGMGILAVVASEKIRSLLPCAHIHVVAVEKDPGIIETLETALEDAQKQLGNFSYTIEQQDFIYWASQDLMSSFTAEDNDFDLVIMNPPYAKIPAASAEARHLKSMGLNTPNLYAAFVALGSQLLGEAGQLLAITPRSWMNGPYFQQYREFLRNAVALTHIHTFESRTKVFKDTGVLQESLITRFEKTQLPLNTVNLSRSVAQGWAVEHRVAPRDSVESQGIVFVPAHRDDEKIIAWMVRATCNLSSIGVQVSTGKVVEFRNRENLFNLSDSNSVPMIYPAHFSAGELNHPKISVKKPQYYRCQDNDKNIVPAGTYVLVKRFSAKEEKRRVTAAVWSSEKPAAFDNKTNYFHNQGKSLPKELAKGLELWLNSSFVDKYFRIFSGHTQVNATDLRMMPYPSVEQLIQMAGTGLGPDEAVLSVLDDKDSGHAAA